jgi:LysM repeat protein
MALPSQQSGPSRRSKHSYRRKNGRVSGRKWLLFMVVLIIAAVVVWITVGSQETTSPANTSVPKVVAAAPLTSATASAQAMNQPPAEPVESVVRPAEATMPEPGGADLTDRKVSSPAAQPTRLTVLPPAGLNRVQPDRENTPIAEPAQPIAVVAMSSPAPTAMMPPVLIAGSLPLITPGSVPAQMQEGLAALQAGQIVEARRLLTQVLRSGQVKPSKANELRELLSDINTRLVFSREIHPEDPFSLTYKVQPNDSLSRIRKKLAVQTDWRFIQRINGISAPNRIRIDQTLKIITGPFHGVVERSTFTMDVYLGEGSEQVYICTLPVGLGEYNATPLGHFRVRPNSKLVNPEWINPRDGTRYTADDALNPIGEYWMGLEGTDEANRDMAGYGIHGTVEPESIGKNASMGCVRMYPEDVELVYQMFAEGISTLEITDARINATAAAE